MSIFTGELNPMPWLQEKLLLALQESTRLVDLANEPDTTPWYAKKLKGHASAIIGRLAPIIVLVYQADQDAAKVQEWQPIIERGTFELARWSKKWGILDPHAFLNSALVEDRDDEEIVDKNTSAEEPTNDDSSAYRDDNKVEIYGAMMLQLMHGNISAQATKLLLWLLYELKLSQYPDVTIVSKKFLPTDCGLSIAETATAYKELYDKGLLQKVSNIEKLSTECLALKIIASGYNDTNKYPPVFNEEIFGYEGARINGKVTSGNYLHLNLADTLDTALTKWGADQATLEQIKTQFMSKAGDRVYVETISLETINEKKSLTAKVRHTFESDPKELTHELEVIASDILREHLLR
jgi:hypothetical protein